jgi:hypothetical protein
MHGLGKPVVVIFSFDEEFVVRPRRCDVGDGKEYR